MDPGRNRDIDCENLRHKALLSVHKQLMASPQGELLRQLWWYGWIGITSNAVLYFAYLALAGLLSVTTPESMISVSSLGR